MNIKDKITLMQNGRIVSTEYLEGTLNSPFTIEKTANLTSYGPNQEIIYTIRVENSLDTVVSPAYVFDDMGLFYWNDVPRFPMDFDMFTVKLKLVTPTETQTGVVGVNKDTLGVGFMFILPAKTTAYITYSARINAYASLLPNSKITNTAALSTSELYDVSDFTTLTVNRYPDLRMTLVPMNQTVTAGERMHYRLTVFNYGNISVSPAISDVVSAQMTGLTLSDSNGEWTEGTQYTYEASTGLLQIPSNVITLSPATFTQGTLGQWVTTPTVQEILISGTATGFPVPQPYINLLPAYTDSRKNYVKIVRIDNRHFTLKSSGTILPKVEIVTIPESEISMEPMENVTLQNRILTVNTAGIVTPLSIPLTVDYQDKKIALEILC